MPTSVKLSTGSAIGRNIGVRPPRARSAGQGCTIFGQFPLDVIGLIFKVVLCGPYLESEVKGLFRKMAPRKYSRIGKDEKAHNVASKYSHPLSSGISDYPGVYLRPMKMLPTVPKASIHLNRPFEIDYVGFSGTIHPLDTFSRTFSPRGNSHPASERLGLYPPFLPPSDIQEWMATRFQTRLK